MRANLKKMRIKNGYTQTEIANKLGVTTRQYQYMEAGTSNGSVTVWKQLRDILGAESIDQLYEN